VHRIIYYREPVVCNSLQINKINSNHLKVIVVPDLVDPDLLLSSENPDLLPTFKNPDLLPTLENPDLLPTLKVSPPTYLGEPGPLLTTLENQDRSYLPWRTRTAPNYLGEPGPLLPTLENQDRS
jgi:hypothetical protein